MRAMIGLLLAILLAGCGLAPLSRPGTKGFIDLSQVNFCGGEFVSLGGEWALHWQQLLSSESHLGAAFPEPDAFVRVPGRWKDIALPQGGTTTSLGFGTLSLRLKLPEKPCRDPVLGRPSDFELSFAGAGTAFEVEVVTPAGERLAGPAGAGKVGTSRETSGPVVCRGANLALPWASEVVLLWRISNFHHVNGGPWEGVRLGLSPTMKRVAQADALRDFVTLGATAILSFYLLFIFLLVPGRLSALWLGLFCLTISIRTLIPTGRIEELLTGSHWWLPLHKAEVAGVHGAVVTFYLFLRTRYRYRHKRILDWIFIPGPLLLVLWTILVPHELFYPLLPLGHVWAVGCILLGVHAVGRAVVRTGSRSSWLVAGGTLVLGCGVALEILTQQGTLYEPGSATRGLMVFLLCEAVSLVLDSQRERNRVERLAKEIHRSAESLRERNGELTQANVELDSTRARLESVLHATRLMNFSIDALHVAEVAVSAMVRELSDSRVEKIDLWLASPGEKWKHFVLHRTVLSESAPLRFRDVGNEAPPECPANLLDDKEAFPGRRSCTSKAWISERGIFLFVGVQKEPLGVVRMKARAEAAVSPRALLVVETLGLSLASVLANHRLIQQEKENLLRLVSVSAKISDRLNSPIMAAVNAVAAIRKALAAGEENASASLRSIEKMVEHLSMAMSSLTGLSRELEDLRERGSDIEPTSTLSGRTLVSATQKKN